MPEAKDRCTDSVLPIMKAAWIWLDEPVVANVYAEFKQTFSVVGSMPGTAELLITVEGQYEVLLNGCWIPSSQCADLPSAKAVSCANVTEQLRAGENTLLVRAWYPGEDTSVSRREPPGMRYALVADRALLCLSGAQTLARRYDAYECGAAEPITPQMGVGFTFTGGMAKAWKPAALAEKEAALVPRPVRELNVASSSASRLAAQGVFKLADVGTRGERMQRAGLFFRSRAELTDAQKPVAFPSQNGVRFQSNDEDGIYLLVDMERITVGYLALEVECPVSTRILVGFGEHLDDLRVRTSIGNRSFAVSVTAGPGRTAFLHRFRRIGCRYLQLMIEGSEITVYEAGIRETLYPVTEGLQFQCADGLHQKIADVSRRTLLNCMHEHYEDCPWREQALYAFDARNQMLAGYYAFGEHAFVANSLRLLALSQRKDGLLEICSPARVPITIPSFSLAFIIALEEYMRFTGDTGFVSQQLAVAQGILRAIESRMHVGIAGNFVEAEYWNFYEWQPLLDGEPIHRVECAKPSLDAVLHLLYILALQRMEAICRALMLGAEAEEYDARAQTAICRLEAFWDAGEGAYASFIRNGSRLHYAELTQALALATNACPPERRQALCQSLLDGSLIPVTLSYSVFKYEALLTVKPDCAPLVFHEIAHRWGNMLFHGATAFWETDEGAAAFEDAGSLCHGWSAIPLYFYGRYALGLVPDGHGGWKQMHVEDCGIPRVQGLMRNGSTPTHLYQTGIISENS